jgi:hypothetical protein
MSTTNNGQQQQRKSLATQLDRLDVILDGLANALNESVADAVRDVVGAVVKDAVASTVREVLSSPELLRAALAKHGPLPTEQPAPVPQRRPITETIGGGLKALCRKAREAAAATGKALGTAWSWSRGKLGAVATATKKAIALACMCPRTSVAALGAGVVVGLCAYLAGPALASVACGLGGALMTAAGMVLWPVWRLVAGGGDD